MEEKTKKSKRGRKEGERLRSKGRKEIKRKVSRDRRESGEDDDGLNQTDGRKRGREETMQRGEREEKMKIRRC